MNQTASSAWHLLTRLAQAAHQPSDHLSELGERLVSIMKNSAICPQGALFRLDNTPAVVAAWGMSGREAKQMLTQTHAKLPPGWRRIAFESSPGNAMAVLRVVGKGEDAKLLAESIGAQLQVLWQVTLGHMIQRVIDTLATGLLALNTIERLEDVVALREDIAKLGDWQLRLITLQSGQCVEWPEGEAVRGGKRFVADSPAQPEPLPAKRPPWLGRPSGWYVRIEGPIDAWGMAVLSGPLAAAPELVPHLRGFLQALASTMARLGHHRDTHQRERVLEALKETLQSVAQQLDVDAFLHTILSKANELLGTAGGAIYSYNSLARQLTIQQILSFPQNYIGTTFDASFGIVGEVLATGRSLFANNYTSHGSRVDLPDDVPITAVAAAPLHDSDTTYGVIAIAHVDPAKAFTPADIALLDSFAAQAGLALRSVRLFEAQRKQARELYVLYENSRAVGSSLDLRHILETLTENANLALGAELSTVLLYDPQANVFEMAAQASDSQLNVEILRQEIQRGSIYPFRADTLPARVVIDQAPVVVVDITTDIHDAEERAFLQQRNTQSCLAVPLIVHDTVIGVLICSYISEARYFQPSEITLAETLAGQAAVAIGNARLLTDERRRSFELGLLHDLSARLASGLNLSGVLESIGQGVQKMINNADLEICLYDVQTETLQTHYATEATRKHFISTTGLYQLDQGFTGWLARHRLPLRIADVNEYQGVRPIRNDGSQQFRSYLGVPMMIGDELIGTLELGHNDIGRFDADDERLLVIMAAQAAQAIKNVRRYEATDEVLRERVRELTALQRISRELNSTLELSQLLPAMLQEIGQATSCSQSFVALQLGDANDFSLVAAEGVEGADAENQVLAILRAPAITGVVERADSLIIDDLRLYQPRIPWPEIASLMLVPILYENRVAGVIVAGDTKPYAFGHSAIEFMRSVADQAALAIGNAQHFAEQVRQRELLQQRASLLNEVLEIGNALRADMALDVLLEQIAFSVSEAAGFRVVVFNLIDAEDSNRLRTITGAGLALAELDVRRSQPILLNDIHQYLDAQYRIGRAYFVPNVESLADGNEWVSGDQLLVPLYNTTRELIGIMTVDDPFSRERPSRRIVETLEIFANQAAIAVENAHLFEVRNRQIAELAAINRISRAATSSLDFASLAREVYEVLRETLPVESYYLVVFNETADEVAASFEIDGETIGLDAAKGPLSGDSLMGWIARHQQPLLFANLPSDITQHKNMQWQQWGEQISRSWIGVPLIAGDGSIRGVISIQHTDIGKYSERDVALMQTLANQLAVAVENARLYGDAQLRLQELGLLNRIGSLTSSTLDLVGILREVFRALKTVLALDVFYSLIYDPLRDLVELRVSVDEDEPSVSHQQEKLLARSPSEWVIKQQQPLLFSDMPEEIKGRFKVKRFGNVNKRVRSWIGVPLKISSEVSVGLLSIQHYAPNMYSERELELLQTVASQVSLAVQNARLFSDRERQIRELDAISQIGQLMSSSFDLDEMLSQTANYLQSVTEAPIFFMLVYNPELGIITKSFAIQEGATARSASQGQPPRPHSLSDWVIRNRRPLNIADTNDADALQALNVVPIQQPIDGKTRSPRSWVGVPVIARDGAPIAMISLQDYNTSAFDERTIAFLTNVSSHVSLGLQKVQLFEERDRQIRELEAMRRVGQVTSSTLDMGEMMHGVHQVLLESLAIDSFVVNVYDPQVDMLVYSLLIDKGNDLDVPPVRPVKPRSLTDWILRNKKPLLFRHLSEELQSHDDIEPLQHGAGPSAQSWLGVPLMAKNEQPIGMLALQHYEPERFDEFDAEFLKNVAYQVTLGVQNVRLYEQTEQNLQQLAAEAERLALINHVSNLTSSTLDPQILYNLAVEEMAHATGADQARLVIFDYEAGVGNARAEFPPGDNSVQVPLRGNATIPWLQQHRRPLIINDVASNPLTDSFRTTLDELGVKRLMLVPLIVNGEIIGSVGLDSIREDSSFTPRDAETCQTIANQVAQALENARLFAQTELQAKVLESKVGELSVLLEAGQALSTIREPQQVLGTIVGLVARQLAVDTVILSTLAPQQELVPTASYGLPHEFVQRIRVTMGKGLIGTVAETSQPLKVANVEAMDPPSQHPDFNREHGLVSFLGVPVLYRNEVTGVLSVMTNVYREFSADETALLSALADQAAIALENARLFAEREHQILMLEAINDVTRAITSTLDTQSLLRTLHSRLGAVVDTRYSFIALYEPEHNRVSFPVMVNDGESVEQEPLPLAEGVLSQVIRERETIVLSSQEAVNASTRIILGGDQPIQSWVGVPITSGDHVLGVITIQSNEPDAFKPESIQFLQGVANQTAIALENARLFTERERQIAEAEILTEISQSVTATLTPDGLAISILQGLSPIFDISNAYIVLYDAPTNVISTTVAFIDGEAHTGLPHLLASDFLKQLLFVQQPLMLNSPEDIAALGYSPQLETLNDDVKMIDPASVMAVPITMGSQTSGMAINQPLGALVLLNRSPNAFDAQQLRFLNAVANQSSNAVQKAMLFSERERRIRELDTLNRISQTITSIISLEEILQRLHDGLNEIVDMGTSFIGLYDESTHTLHYEQAYDQGQPVTLNSGVLSQNVNAWVIEHRQPLLLNNAEEADEYRDPESRLRLRQTRVGSPDKIEQSFLVVPIVVGNRSIGVINIQSYERNAFSEYDMGFVSTVAAQAAASIANARLFEARERSIQQLRTLSTIGQALGSTVRFEDLLRVIYEQTSLLVNTRNFYIALYDERRDEVSFPLFYEHGTLMKLEPQRSGNGLTEYVIRTRQPLVLQDGSVPERMQELGVALVGEFALSWIGIPLIAADKVIGVMSIQDFEQGNAYTDDDVQLLTTVANQAAQALENARLFSESRESVRELSTLSETSVSLASTLDIEELLAISASSAIEMARADFGGVIVIDPDNDRITHSLILDSFRSDFQLPVDSTNISDFQVLRPLRLGQTVTVYDAAVDHSLAPFTDPLGIRGAVFLPMMREGLRGVVFVGMAAPHTFEDRSVASLLILTTQIGQALNNAQLFDQIRRFNLELEEIVMQRTQAVAEANTQLTNEKERVEALYNIATELGTTLDRSELLVRTLDLSAKALNVSRGTVLMLNRETRQLTCQAVLNDEIGLRSLDTPVAVGQEDTLAHWVLNNSEGVVIGDVKDDERWVSLDQSRSDEVRGLIAVPLFSSDQPQGVLMLYSSEPGYFSNDHLRFLSTISGEVSSALQNADLYNLVFESADRLSEAMWQQREDASKTNAILQSVSEGVIVLDHDTDQVILYNPAAAQVLRIPRSEVIEQPIKAFALPRDEKEHHEEGRALLIYSALLEGVSVVKKNDTVHTSMMELPGQPHQIIEAIFGPVSGEDGQRFGVVVVLRDITREVEADRAKREFIATVSHELRTPLTPIRGFVDLMLLGAVGPVTDAQRETLNTIKNNTMRMVGLVEDLLEIGRLESGKITLNTSPANINSLVQDTVGMWTGEIANKSMKLTLELDESLPMVEYDTKRIGQVMTNLVSNAIKYTYAGGAVTIRTFKNEKGLMQVDVKDTGVGLTPDQQTKLFKRFYRAESPLSEEVGGTGLGLSIAKSFVELHHGDMWVESVYGEGSTFSFTLPFAQPRPDLGEREDIMPDMLNAVQPFEESGS